MAGLIEDLKFKSPLIFHLTIIPLEQSNLGPYCLQYRLPKNSSGRDNRSVCVCGGGGVRSFTAQFSNLKFLLFSTRSEENASRTVIVLQVSWLIFIHLKLLRKFTILQIKPMEAQWLRGRVLDRRHCVVVLKQDTFILA